ncbi:MAG: hypothetical protein JO352_22005 [Chloroflexi bacterium]|nr:hypothetical protein [Chloroflexota bacterium]
MSNTDVSGCALALTVLGRFDAAIERSRQMPAHGARPVIEAPLEVPVLDVTQT